MKRREFITLLSGAASAWPFAARAQQGGPRRRVGVLMSESEDDRYARGWLSAFVTAFAELGWSEGRNLLMEVRWGAYNLDLVHKYAKELVELKPDVILAEATPPTAAVQRETRTIPVVFTIVSDPVGSGFVDGLSRPGSNMTGFSTQEPSMAGKWVELLTEIAPGRRRVAAIFNPDTAPYVSAYYLPLFEAAARSLKLEPIVLRVRSDTEIEPSFTSLGRESGGVILMPDPFLFEHRASIISLAEGNNIPTVSHISEFTREGLLISYGPEFADLFRRAAPYVDRILRGAKPADLPVQLPVKFEMAVNLKTAKALGLIIPPTVLTLADEVIQ